MKPLVKSGARCRVGNRVSISISSDPWLQDKDNPWITTVNPAFIGAKVSSLMHADSSEWDVDAIKDLFNDRDSSCILSIPLCSNRPIDNWYWSLESSGIFSVKSCYKSLQVLKNGEASEMEKLFWQGLLKVRVPPKVKDLVWRASSGCLPTKTQLHLRHVDVDIISPLCQSDRETVSHFLVACSRVWPCWVSLGLGLLAPDSETFGHWLMQNLVRLDQEQKAKVFMLLWAVWRRQNEWVWQNKRGSCYGVLLLADSTLKTWIKAQDREIAPLPYFLSPEDGRELWSKPPLGSLKINVDAASFIEASKHSFAGIARDHNDDCKVLWKDLDSVSIVFVKRSANGAAHALAKASSFVAERVLVKENISSNVLEVMLQDCC
ncbi:uncharacterized protein LOC133792608 [Humulus lupulus]|uniref:uncharacterized protein LOC133792608 n=1 Tax=Humulus lupulus TaxID=3486 RepID=UPI002B416194|nr:uncharacterized protein LOC133792608 [Humulus lupulus]